MKLNILDASQDPLHWTPVFLSAFTLQGIKSDDADETAKQKDGQPAKQAATSPDSEKGVSSPSGSSRRQRFLLPLALIGIVYSAYLVFCLTFLVPSYGKDFDDGAEPFFNATTDVPLFYGAILFFIWKAAAELKWRRISEFERAVYMSPFGLAAQWVACAVVRLNESSISQIVLYPFCEKTRDIDHRLLGHLDPAFQQSLPARIILWALVVMLSLGHAIFTFAFTWIKFTSASGFLILMYKKLRQPCLQYLLCPLGRNVFQPLFRHVIMPLLRITLAPLGSALHQYLLIPLERTFPGPSTKTEHAFAEPTVELITFTFLISPVFVAVTSAIIFTTSKDDKYLWPQKSSTALWLYLGIFYTMVAWLVWRAASALNFAPAVSFDRLVYSSRIGWILQGLVFFPWLYSLWRVAYFPWAAFLRDEGTVGRFLVSIRNFGSFTIVGWEFHPVGSVLQTYFQGGTILGFISIIVCLVLAMRAYIKGVARMVPSYSRGLYNPAPSTPMLDSK